jgi:hypothetical protein
MKILGFLTAIMLSCSVSAAGDDLNRKMNETIQQQTTPVNRPAVVGTWYEATVPDTLDLAERARMSLRFFDALTDREHGYEMYWEATISGPEHQFSPLMACQPKAMEAMAMARLMCGSTEGLETEAKMLEEMASHIGPDGIYWVPKYADRPWLGSAEDLPMANAGGQGRMIYAMLAWYQYTGNPFWKENVNRMVQGVSEHMVVHKDDYAYFPIYGWLEKSDYFRNCYTPKGWRDTAEPPNEKAGEEKSLFNAQGHTPGALANWYRVTGNEDALKFSGELTRFLTKPKFWNDWDGTEFPGMFGAEHAHWCGHYTGHMNTLRAIFEYAQATHDARLMQFVRDGYEWARQGLMARIGYVGGCCGYPRLMALAIKLSRAGVGDYWEDVDFYIRNHCTEVQVTPGDLPELQKLAAEQFPGKDCRKYIENMVGGFGRVLSKDRCALCCSPHGTMGLYYAWDSIIQYEDGDARINLLLNRSSPWMDIDSYLPYEGKVVLKNKSVKEAFVRMPLWVDEKAVTCRIADRDVTPRWLGRYLHIIDLKPSDVITLEFPMAARTETWTIPAGWGRYNVTNEEAWPGHTVGKTVLTMTFRGNTLIDCTPPMHPTLGLYKERKEQFSKSPIPMKTVLRYASPMILQW